VAVEIKTQKIYLTKFAEEINKLACVQDQHQLRLEHWLIKSWEEICVVRSL